jgi:ABC-type microcin C transport system duplicated ATPase subunit YejF
MNWCLETSELWNDDRCNRSKESLAHEALSGWDRENIMIMNSVENVPNCLIHNMVSTSIIKTRRGVIDLVRFVFF